MPALRPVEEPFAPGVADVLKTYPQRNGYILQLFRVFANSLRFLEKGVVNLLDRESPLPLRFREIVILRVTSNLDCEYEWGVHVAAFREAAGLTDDQVRATRLGDATSPCWSDEEGVLIRIIDELCASGTLGPEARAQFERTWTLEQQLEIMALCGNYHTICYVANVAGIDREAFGAKFPPRDRFRP